MRSVFISYRRADAGPWAGRLYDCLKIHLGGVRIFRDVDDIPPGVEFDTYILEAVGACEALIVLIGPAWLKIADKTGRRRLDDPTDYARQEIAAALKRNVRVVPALVAGADMPTQEDLPDELKPLARRQAYELTDKHWADDCRRLADVLRPLVKDTRSPRKAVLITASAMAAVGLAAMVVWWQRAVPLVPVQTPSGEMNNSQAKRTELIASPAESSVGKATDESTGKVSAQLPNVKIGDIAVTQITNLKTGQKQPPVTAVVEKVTNDRIVVRFGKSTWRTYTREWNWMETKRDNVIDAKASPAQPHFKFPLKVGDNWDAQFTASSRAGEREYEHQWRVEVEAQEKVTVPAGTFDAFRLRAVGHYSGRTDSSAWTGRSVRIYWYAPAISRMVKHELEEKSISGTPHELREAMELLIFKPAM